MKRPLDQLAEIAKTAVAIGNDLIRNTRPLTVTEKSDRDTYTNVDVQIERQVRAYLSTVTPEIGFLGEEEGGVNQVDNEHVWMLDPIDGTANFVHGIPLSATQIALVRSGVPVVSAMSMPYIDTLYWAVTGKGAFANDQSIHVSSASNIKNAIVSIGDYATGDGAAQKNRERVAVTSALANHVERVRMFGSAAIDFAWLSEGKIDAVVILSNSALDTAPGVLIAQEAGALVTDRQGKAYSAHSKSVIACTPALAEPLHQALKSEYH